jgi:hypothetical protein
MSSTEGSSLDGQMSDLLERIRVQQGGEAVEDPWQELLRRWLEQRQAPPVSEAPWPEERPAYQGTRPYDARMIRRLERAHDHITLLSQRLESLARALGACSECWGEYELCEHCSGTGSPGALPVDAALYSQLIEPAVQRSAGTVSDKGTESEERSRNDGDQSL